MGVEVDVNDVNSAADVRSFDSGAVDVTVANVVVGFSLVVSKTCFVVGIWVIGEKREGDPSCKAATVVNDSG